MKKFTVWAVQRDLYVSFELLSAYARIRSTDLRPSHSCRTQNRLIGSGGRGKAPALSPLRPARPRAVCHSIAAGVSGIRPVAPGNAMVQVVAAEVCLNAEEFGREVQAAHPERREESCRQPGIHATTLPIFD